MATNKQPQPVAEPKGYNLGIRIDKALRDRIKRAASFEKRKMSDWARLQIEAAVDDFEREHPRHGHHSSGPRGENDG